MIIRIEQWEQLYKEDLALISLCREIGYGEIQLVRIRAGKPVLAEKVVAPVNVVAGKAIKTIKLES